ncbi:MAG: hypothetical protein H6Q58_1277 [Firmicutes bacterium]|nr:hypothetical protein [Bacillota bacterium]
MKVSSNGKGFMWFIIILGAVSGSIIGDIVGNNVSWLSFLKASYSIGTQAPLVLDLKVLVLTLGLNFKINIMSIIGTIMAIILYKRY